MLQTVYSVIVFQYVRLIVFSIDICVFCYDAIRRTRVHGRYLLAVDDFPFL